MKVDQLPPSSIRLISALPNGSLLPESVPWTPLPSSLPLRPLHPHPPPHPNPLLSLERHVGELVAAAAGTIALALSEFQSRGLTGGTKKRGGEAIAALFKLRQFMIGTWDFDGMARTHGRAVLRECCGRDVTDAFVDVLVDSVLEILAKVTRDQLN